MTELRIDIETYSSEDLRIANVYRYTEADDFDVMMAYWSFDGGPVQGSTDPDEILALPLRDSSVLKVAHNAQFERVCFSRFLGLKPGRYLDPREWDCTAVLAAEYGWPRGLDNLAKALGVEEKDSAGTALINWFCMPDRNGKRRMPADHPEKWAQFEAYCKQDVVTLNQVREILREWPSQTERKIWLADQRINDRGIRFDREMVTMAVATGERDRARAEAELAGLLDVDNPGSVQQFTAGLARLGLEVPNLRAETVTALLDGDLEHEQRRALELRQRIALVASKKYQAVLAAGSPDDRLRGQFVFHGAHTGRWSSRGVQIQNLPRVAWYSKAEEKALSQQSLTTLMEARISAGVLDLRLGNDLDPETLKGLVRSLFLGPFTVVDYSAIEARGLAWLAGESWVLEAFREKRDIYVETATRMSTPDRPLNRQQGKVAVLALGYAGGVNSLRNMGADGTDEELQALVYAYRRANLKIKNLWTNLEGVFMDGGQAGRLRVQKVKKDRLLVLPSGRALTYHDVRVAEGPRGPRITFQDPKGFRNDTYGGRLAENATQAICRDILAGAILNLEAEGYPVVGHVHDEAIIEGEYPVQEVAAVMCRLPKWAKGFPLDAEGFTCSRYRKD